jgi:hypothetical protein
MLHDLVNGVKQLFRTRNPERSNAIAVAEPESLASHAALYATGTHALGRSLTAVAQSRLGSAEVGA